MVKDKDQQIGPRCQLAGFPLASRARLTHLGEAWGVGQEEASLVTVQRIRVILGVLGRAHDRLALAGLAAEKRADQRSLACGAGSEDHDVKLASILTGSKLGELFDKPCPSRLIRYLDHTPASSD